MLTKSQFSNCLLHTFGILLSIFVFHFTNIEASQKVLHINQGKIQKVKLYTDRAEIFRQIPLQIPVGSSDLIIGPFPASLTPDSLRISPGKSSSIRIGSFSIQKKYKTQFIDLSIQNQEDRVQQFRLKLNSINDILVSVTDQLNYIENLTGGKIQSNIIPGPEYWDSVLEFKATRGKIRRDHYRETFVQFQTAEKELQVEEKLLEDMKTGIKKEANYIYIKIDSERNTADHLNISYQIRNAGWKPIYRLRTDTTKKSIAFEYIAKIRQKTGEDWEEVTLELTTSQPSRGTTPPKLRPWVIDYAPPPIKLYATEESQPLRTQSMVQGFAKQGGAISLNTQIVQSGISLTYLIPQKQTIASGSSNFNTLIFSKDFAADLTYITIPKYIQNVFLKAKTRNSSPYQLLTGPIKNFVDGSFVGNSWLKNTAPGQEIELGLGLDDSFEVKRKLIKKEGGEGGIFNQVQKQRYVFEISLKNFKNKPFKIEVKDQLPLSYQEDIKVQINQINPEPDNTDKQNFLTWNIELQPLERKTLTLDFQVEYPEGKTVEGL